MATKTELLTNLRVILRDALRLQSEGTQRARAARAQGYIDGYMCVLLDTGTATRKELLQLVAEERERELGPATLTLQQESAAA